MKRILEPEAMEDLGEVIAYDSLVSDLQGELLDRCFAQSLANIPAHNNFKLLDVCTGTGRIPICLSKITDKYAIHAVDISRNMIALARLNKEKQFSALHLTQADARNLPFPDNHFDVVSCHVSLHHFKDPLPVLKEINRVAKTESSIMIRDLRRPLNRTIAKLFVRIFGANYNEMQKKLYFDSLLAAFSPNELKTLAAEAGMSDCIVKSYFITHIGLERIAGGMSQYSIKGAGLQWRIMQHQYISN